MRRKPRLKNLKLKYVYLLFAFIFCALDISAGTKYGVIISARSGNQSLFDINHQYCEDAYKLMAKNNFHKENINIFFEGGKSAFPGSKEVTSDAVISTLQMLAKKLTKADELWVFLFGYANKTTRGLSIATKGKRLSGKQLADILDKIKCRQIIFAMNRQSSALMPLLNKRSDRIIVTATDNDKEYNPPIYPRYLFQVWLKEPSLPLLTVIRTAGDKLREYYTNNSLAIAEEPQAFDGKELVSYPFDSMKGKLLSELTILNSTAMTKQPAVSNQKKTSSAASPLPTKESLGPLDFSEFDNNNKNIAKQIKESLQGLPPLSPPTTETAELIRKARKMSKEYGGFSAYYTNFDNSFTVNSDRSSQLVTSYNIYLLNTVAAEKYARMSFSDTPPDNEITIQKSRIIYPDGSYRDIQPEELFSNGARYHNLKFGGAEKGCMIQLVTHYSIKPQTQIPEFQRSFILQHSIPIATGKLTIKVPKKQYFNIKLYNTDTKLSESLSEYSRNITFDLGKLPAFEPLSYDPPLADCIIRLQISSLKSWEDFSKWVNRILKGSNAVNDELIAFTKELTKGAKSDTEKVKAIYEFLNRLRYETTPIGARAFRPRLPIDVCKTKYGDCKDKANALVTMAGILGIKGYMALLNRMSVTDKTFPSWQFNHAVAFFPKLSGYPNGVWCDATDGSTAFGSLPPGDIGRAAFLIETQTPQFKTIMLPSGNNSHLSQTISLHINKDKTVNGTITYEAEGLTSYYLRQRLKRMSPLQSKDFFQKQLNNSLRGLIVDKYTTSSLIEDSKPLKIKLTCSGLEWSLIRSHLQLPYDLWAPVAQPKRNRPLMLNDGQPITIKQHLIVNGDDNLPHSFEWSQNSDILDTSVKDKVNNKGWERMVKVKLKKSIVQTKAYISFRKQIITMLNKINNGDNK